MIVLDEFYDWVLSLEVIDRLVIDIKKLNFNEKSNNSMKKTIVLDMENDFYIGKYIIWEDNSCFVELIEVDSENQILHERKDCCNLEELKSQYKKIYFFFERSI
ncbi:MULTISPECIES: immunity protein TriTu family protein [unclassified Myroides]|uniref:immunity protein TriTu family protein n=1 Tax=unclassified Myroides TaxID=2642485 RepID=UPI003D2F7662